MPNTLIRPTGVILTLSLLALAACLKLGEGQTPSSTFYQLNPIGVSSGEGQIEEGDQGLAIAVGPVDFPDYLNRPQMVIRQNQNELELDEFHRWAGPLKENFSSVLEENLSILLSSDRIAVFPWSRFVPTDYQVAVRVIRFDGRPGESASLVARWSILKRQTKEAIVVKSSSFSEPADKYGYKALVLAQSRTVEALSREIAATIKDMPR
jgi:uncharacterized lipoprotein YmbA